MNLLIIFILSTLTLNAADNSYWTDEIVRPYVHNSELQRRWAMAFMAPHLKELKGNEAILDVGCGDGKITADISRFIPDGSISGIDLSKDMIYWAKRQYHPLEYPNLQFSEGSFHEPIVEDKQYDVIVSFCALQHSFDQRKAIRELSHLLKPGGKILMLVPTRSNPYWNKSRAIVQAYEKWSPYWKGVPARSTLPVEEYLSMMIDSGLEAVVTKHITMDPFVDREEIIEWLLGTFAPVIPKNESRAFFNDWMDQYLRQYPQAINDEGVIYAELGYITLVGTKQE